MNNEEAYIDEMGRLLLQRAYMSRFRQSYDLFTFKIEFQNFLSFFKEVTLQIRGSHILKFQILMCELKF